VIVVLSVTVDSLDLVAMACCKNVSGHSRGGDEERDPPCLIEKASGKRKVLAKRKRKRADRDTEMAAAAVAAAEHVERGGRGSGIQIGESCFHLEG
jgi:transposase InsO family protein